MENNVENSKKEYGIKDVLKKLPHYYPFLLLDKVTHLSEKDAQGIKNVTFNEPFFPGHFPNNPVMPGVLQVEALAQLAAFHYLTTNSDSKSDFYFASIDKVKFRKIVVPGDVLELKIKLLRKSNAFNKYAGEIVMGNTLVCQNEFMAVIQKKVEH